MNNLPPLVLSAVFGLIAGISHGVSSHYQDLPFSLGEQMLRSITIKQSLSE